MSELLTASADEPVTSSSDDPLTASADEPLAASADDPLTSSADERLGDNTFALRAVRRLDPTPGSALICVEATFENPTSTSSPYLLCLGTPEGCTAPPVSATEQGEAWSGEYAIATALLDDPRARLVLLLPGGILFDLPKPASAGVDGDPPEDEAPASPDVHPQPEARPARTEPPPVEPESRQTRRGLGRLATAAALLAAAGAISYALQDSEPPRPAAAPASPRADADGSRTSAAVQAKLTPAQVVAQTPKGMSLVARGVPRRIGLYRRSTTRRPWTFLRNPNTMGSRTVFLVKAARANRYKVALPIRPNGATAWIRAADVRMVLVDYRVKVDLRRHRMTVWRGERRVARSRIGVGRSLTPTPSGLYYTTALLKQPNPKGIYGPYAVALSAHSTVLNEFAGGNGRIGLHGTNEPDGIGSNVSHGCIRVRNPVIRRLARMLPLGTPVRISH